jgi:hypothetical protein
LLIFRHLESQAIFLLDYKSQITYAFVVISNGHTETLSQQSERLIPATVKLPEKLWSAVKKLAVDRRTSAQSIWIEAMSEYLDRQDKARG